MPHYTLKYFSMRGRGEISRLIFAEADVPYEDVRIDKADWPNHKSQMPFGQVPVLEIDGKVLPQSRAIAKYLAKEYHLDGKTNLESAFCDAMVDGVEDTNIAMRPYKREKDPIEKEKRWCEFKDQYLTSFLTLYEKFLGESGSGYFVGNSLTWADLFIFNYIQGILIRRKSLTILDNYPNLQKFMDFIAQRPNIKTWLNKRPFTET